MDVDDDRPPSPPAPAFVKRSKPRGARGAATATASSVNTSLDGSNVSAAGAEASSSSRPSASRRIRSGFGAEDDAEEGGDSPADEGPSVVVRSRGFNASANRNRLKGTQSVVNSGSQSTKPAPTALPYRILDNVGEGSSTPSASSPAPSRPAPPPEPVRQSSSSLMQIDGGDDANEDFIPIRTRRAPAQSVHFDAQPFASLDAPVYLEEEFVMPVYENQEVLPDPGPLEDGAEILKQPFASLGHQPSRLDEPQEREPPARMKTSAMKEEGVLPSLTSASARLDILLGKAESATAQYEVVVLDANTNLERLVEEEKENKKVVGQAGDKEAWFRELNEFIATIARFLDTKMPMLEVVERDNVAIVAQRTRMIQKARAKDAEDELALFYGVPAVGLLPPSNAQAPDADAEVISAFQAEEEPNAIPSEDGPALSPIREARRVAAAQRPPGQDDELSPPDRIAFQDARGEIYAQLQKIAADVLAPEFLDPAATIDEPTTEQNGGVEGPTLSASGLPRRRPHPASLVSRFGIWRTRYEAEYVGTWGGLALAGAWEFWCRRELADVDLLRPAARYGGGSGGGDGPGQEANAVMGLDLSRFAWHQRLSEYVRDSKLGGDDEAIEAMIGNVVIPRLVALAEGQGFDPWSAKDGASIIFLAKQMYAAVEPNGWRFQSFSAAYIGVFRTHIAALLRAITELPPALPPVGIHPAIPAARLSFLQRLVQLYTNAAAWYPLVAEAERGSLTLLLDDLVGRGIWPLLIAAKDFGSAQVAVQLLTASPEGALTGELVSRLSSFASNA
ncbi:hypothetical protein V8E36_000379 [Tilletia maclaganii]